MSGRKKLESRELSLRTWGCKVGTQGSGLAGEVWGLVPFGVWVLEFGIRGLRSGGLMIGVKIGFGGFGVKVWLLGLEG